MAFLEKNMNNFGFLNINKPRGMTSHDVVALLRRIMKIKQIGHTGTLDPMAAGVLPVAVGKAARLIEYLDEGKSYRAELLLGKVSDSYDTEGNIIDFSDKKVCQQEIESALNNFEGEIEQVPPAYSAVHYNGKRLYELARQGMIPDDIPTRKVVVNSVQLVDFDETAQCALLDIDCSKGTYIRSIIHDLGQLLGCGAVMSGLVRTKSGVFTIENALHLTKDTPLEEIQKYLINPVEVLSYKCCELSDLQLEKIKHGQSLPGMPYQNVEFVCLTYAKELCAIAQMDCESKRLITKKVFV